MAIATSSTTAQLPAYVQIAERLLRDIAAGRLVAGMRLPPERILATEFSVSIGTLRKALKLLEEKQVLERVHGSGNYVRAGGEASGIYSMFRLELPEGGGLPRAQVIAVDHMDKPADLPVFGTSTQATRIRRLRWLNDTMIALEEIWLDGGVGRITQSGLSESLYHAYQTQLGLWIRRAEDRVRLAALPGWVPSDFPKAHGALLGYIERFSWSDAVAPVEFSRTWFDPDRAHYVQRLK